MSMKRLWLALTVGALGFWACDDSSSASSDDEVVVETSSSVKAEAKSSSTMSEVASSSSKKSGAKSSSSKAEAKSSSAKAGVVASSSSKGGSAESSAEPAPKSSSSEKSTEVESSSSVVPLYSDVDTLYSGYFEMIRKDGCSLGKEPPKTTAAFYSEGGETLLKVESALGDCLDSAMYAMSRVGDTLLVFWDENNLMTNCVCTSDHVFKVSEKETDAKVVKYVSWWGENWHDYDVFKISSAPELAVSSSSDEPLSSSETAPADEPDVLVDVNKYGYAIGMCGSDAYDTGVKALAKAKTVDDVSVSEVAELKKGFLLEGDGGRYQVWLPEASDYCDVEAKVKMKRDSDTLFISMILAKLALPRNAVACRTTGLISMPGLPISNT